MKDCYLVHMDILTPGNESRMSVSGVIQSICCHHSVIQAHVQSSSPLNQELDVCNEQNVPPLVCLNHIQHRWLSYPEQYVCRCVMWSLHMIKLQMLQLKQHFLSEFLICLILYLSKGSSCTKKSWIVVFLLQAYKVS